VPGLDFRASGNVPCEKATIISTAASAPWPFWIISNHLRPVGSVRSAGSPARRRGKNPMLSEWSATTRKSSGRDSFAGWPDDATISSPLAKR
jgi:hypothetical protein